MTTDLRTLAEQATPEAWDLWDWASWREGDGDQAGRLTLDPYQSRANVALTVAASPDRILALLDERDRLQAALLAVTATLEAAGGDPADPGIGDRIRAALGSDR